MFDTGGTFVPKILGECYRAYRTGTLVLTNDTTVKKVYFDCGNIAAVESNIPDESIEEFLAQWGDYDKFELEDLFAQHISEAIYSMLEWRSVEADFDESPLPEFRIKTLLFTPQILLEGISRISDIDFVKSMLGDTETPLRFETDAQ